MRSFFGHGKGNKEKDAGLSSSSSSQSSPSKKGKKGSSDSKPKQPQRGLGVAQLERIRLHNQLGGNYYPNSAQSTYVPNLNQEDTRPQTAYSYPSNSSFAYNSSSSSHYGFQGSHGVMMGFQDSERAEIRYGESEPTNVARWDPGNTGFGIQQYVEPSMTRSLFDPPGYEGAPSYNENYNKDWNESMGLISQDSESQEIDLELRLSR